MLNIAIVEDDPREAERIEQLLKSYAEETNEACQYTRFDDGMSFIDRFKPVFDAVFMDIEMPLVNGMKAAKWLRTVDREVPLIFITNLKQYALRGYEYEAMDFLVKPIRYPAFATMMARVRRHIGNKHHQDVCISEAGATIRLSVQDIFYVEVSQHYIVYHTVNGEHRFWGSLTTEEGRLPCELFAKCSKCYLVNLSHVKRVEGFDLFIADDVLRISRGQKPEFMRRLSEWIERL